MKILLEVKDSKAGFLMELLENLDFVVSVKAETAKKKQLKGLAQSFSDVKEAEAGTKKLKSAKAFLNEV